MYIACEYKEHCTLTVVPEVLSSGIYSTSYNILYTYI